MLALLHLMYQAQGKEDLNSGKSRAIEKPKDATERNEL